MSTYHNLCSPVCQSSKTDVYISIQSLQSIVELPDAHIHIYEENCPVLPVLLFPDCIGRLVAATVARRARLFSPPSASEPFPLFFVPIRPDCPIYLTNQFQIFKAYGNLGLAVFQLGVELTLFDPVCFGPFKTGGEGGTCPKAFS